jgi:lysophospholipase L1-like esterase
MATVKFPAEMDLASAIAGDDKLMIAKATTGESMQATFDSAKQYLNITSIEMKPVPAGALPAGPAGQVRTMEILAAGTWTYGGNSFINPSGSIMKLWWDGTTWSLGSSVALPTPPLENKVSTVTDKAITPNGVTVSLSNNFGIEKPVASTYDLVKVKPLYTVAPLTNFVLNGKFGEGFYIDSVGAKNTSQPTSITFYVELIAGTYVMDGLNTGASRFYRVEKKSDGSLLANGLLSSLPLDSTGAARLLTVTETVLFYFTVYLVTIPNIQNINNVRIYQNTGNVYQQDIGGKINKLGGSLLDVGINTTTTYNLYDPTSMVIKSLIYIDSAGNKQVLPAGTDAIVLRVPLSKGTDVSRDIVIQGILENAYGFYRVEKTDGTKISNGVLSSLAAVTGGRKLTITEDVVFYTNIYFKPSSGTAANMDSGKIQLVYGSEAKPYKYYAEITTIQNVPFNVPTGLVVNRFYGLTIITAGDSITQGTMGGYVKYLGEIVGCLVQNVGSSGAKTNRLTAILTDIKDRSDTSQTYITPDYTKAAAITIMIGTNVDAVTGSIADIPANDSILNHVGTELEYLNTFPNTYYGNLGLIIEFIKWKNPKIEIFLVSPPYGNLGDADLVSTRMREIAQFYSINFFDGTHSFGLTKKLKGSWTYDGTHLNEYGNEVWGKSLANRLLGSK